MIRRKPTQHEVDMLSNMMNLLGEIYSNKSSDEYKCRGDIRKVRMYHEIEKQLTDLTSLKRFSAVEAKDLKNMFNTLHRPVFAQMVSEYMNEPNERNSVFTALFTVGYRVLVGELARIYASTEATEKGLVYKPDKISRRKDLGWFIKAFNDNIDGKIDEYIRSTYSESAVFHESVSAVLTKGAKLIAGALNVIPNIFRGAKELNPISFMNAMLMRSYDKKIDKYDTICAMYDAAKEAYDEYLHIPESDRKRKIESKYQKNIQKYNIKMNNLKAQIDHFDSRAMEETNDLPTSQPPKKESVPKDPATTSTDDSSDDFDF